MYYRPTVSARHGTRHGGCLCIKTEENTWRYAVIRQIFMPSRSTRQVIGGGSPVSTMRWRITERRLLNSAHDTLFQPTHALEMSPHVSLPEREIHLRSRPVYRARFARIGSGCLVPICIRDLSWKFAVTVTCRASPIGPQPMLRNGASNVPGGSGPAHFDSHNRRGLV